MFLFTYLGCPSGNIKTDERISIKVMQKLRLYELYLPMDLNSLRGFYFQWETHTQDRSLCTGSGWEKRKGHKVKISLLQSVTILLGAKMLSVALVKKQSGLIITTREEKMYCSVLTMTYLSFAWYLATDRPSIRQSVQFSHSVVSDSLWPHESQHTRPPCPSPTSGVHSDSRPSSQWCHPAISSSVVPFSSCP